MSKNIAIITGASSGIGKAFLEEIVKEHGAYGCVPFDEIWAVARREDKLIEIKTLLGEDRIVPVVADLSSPEDMTVLADRLALEKPQIGLLINCAGIGKKGLVEDHPAKALEDTIDVNCTSLAKLTRICMPYMIVKTPMWTKDNSPRIINIASSAGFLPQPGFAAYAASKAFVISFSRALYYELIDHNIIVTTVCPGPVKTDFQRKATGGAQADFTGFRQYVVADPVKLARAAIKASRNGRQILVYGFSQKALHVASKLFPTSWILSIEKKLMPKMLEADMLVLTTPLYYYGMSAQLKTIVDRFYSRTGKLNGKKSMLIATAYNSADWTFQALVAHYETLVRYMNWTDAGQVLGLGCGSRPLVEKSEFGEIARKIGARL